MLQKNGNNNNNNKKQKDLNSPEILKEPPKSSINKQKNESDKDNKNLSPKKYKLI